MSLSNRVANISASQTQELIAKAKAMKSQGLDVIEFQTGEPDFNTPYYIKEAGMEAIRNNFSYYTAVAGILEFRETICEKLYKDNGLAYYPENIVVSNGAKHSLYNLFMVMLDKGDEVIIPSPYWVSYPEMVKLADGVPVIVETAYDEDYKITPEKFKEAITSKTKMLIINSPSNPTGFVYTKKELEQIAEIATANNIYIVSDEVYEKLVYDGMENCSIGALGEDIKKLTITINAVSKSYAMTGWRIGYAAAEEEIAKAMVKIQGHATSGPCSISQKAAHSALLGDQGEVEKMRLEFDKRRKIMADKLNSIPGVSCKIPQGTFYAFPDISGLFGQVLGGIKVTNSKELAEVFLEKCYVVAVQGSAFGSDNNMRFSYAASVENIEEGLDRIIKLAAGKN